jgi:tetratricopeptide (TPR) repeat protein
MKSILTLFALLASWATLEAQTTTVSSPTTGNVVAGVQVPAEIQNKQKAFNSSQAHFAARNYAAAENVLEAANLAAPSTPQWHFESGFSLVRMAAVFQSQADAVSSAAIAKLALAHLTLADQNYPASTSPGEIASEKELTGYIYQFFLGDPATAKTYYQAAVNLSPDTGNAAALLAAIIASETAEAQKRASAQGH